MQAIFSISKQRISSFSSVRTQSNQKTYQQLLQRTLHDLFPKHKLLFNDRSHGLSLKKVPFELDIHIPTLKIAFEFQDAYHYNTQWYSSKEADEVVQRDNLKRAIAESKGLTVIAVPYWWDGKRESLIATIQKYRPDLLNNLNVDPNGVIPDKIPEKEQQVKRGIKGFGELTQATFYTNDMDTNGWLLFEKYDGIRGFWDGPNNRLLSRFGNELKIPDNIINKLSMEIQSAINKYNNSDNNNSKIMMNKNIYLDGELWFGRGMIKESMKISGKSDPRKIDWSRFRYVIYDLPIVNNDNDKDKDNDNDNDNVNDNVTYGYRYNLLKHLFIDHIDIEDTNMDTKDTKDKEDTTKKIIKVAIGKECNGKEELERLTEEIIRKGGEGIIMRNPNGIYKHGVSKDYVKFKLYRDDDAKLLRKVSIDRWECILPSGTTFQAPLDKELIRILRDDSDKDIKEPDIKEGLIVSYKYTNWNNDTNKPRSPVIYRIRNDMDWNDVINNYNDPLRRRSNNSSSSSSKTSKSNNRSRNKLAGNKKVIKEKGYWNDSNNVRKFFDELAKDMGFDPNDTNNWYEKVKMKDIINRKDGIGRSIMNKYNNSLKYALINIYNHLNWDISKFNKKNYWTDINNCKSFFDNFASLKGFDPNDISNWYNVSIIDILSIKGGKGILSRYKGSLKNALIESYPNLSFNINMFRSNVYLTNRDNVKKFFDDFSKYKGFDPNDINNWINISDNDINSFISLIKSTTTTTTTTIPVKHIINHFKGGLKSALKYAYPNLDWDKVQLKNRKYYWTDINNCKRLFDEFASLKGFDPNDTSNWYNVKLTDISSTSHGTSGYHGILSHYKSIKRALIASYPNNNWSDKWKELK